jgi:PhoD-like phosphatase
MYLKAYAHAAPQGKLKIWVGVFGVAAAPGLRFQIDGTARQPEGLPADGAALHLIRDHRDCNHQGLFTFSVPGGGRRHRVEVFAGDQQCTLITQSLPDSLPGTLDGEFHILLSSCYFQPNDGGGLLGTVVQQLRRQPDMVLLAGDQVYLDLPLFEDLPEGQDALARAVGDKYLKNWASDTLGVPGLAPVLAKAPVVCLPDDHEFWNNFPFKQKQLPNLWDSKVRDRWQRSALELYQDYQVGGQPEAVPRGAIRIDVLPMRMLFVDMRCVRDQQFDKLMSPDARSALMQWAEDLLKARAQGKPAVGLLSSGQALFITPPHEESKKRDVDAEMGNYREFDDVLEQIARLTDAGIPVVYVTGDVHWSRVAKAADTVNQRTLLYEVICSPSRLISTPLMDTFKDLKSFVGGIFGPKDPWPHHPDLDKLPEGIGPGRRYRPQQALGRRGDQVAVLSFTGGANVQMRVTYYAISDDKRVAQSETTGPFSLNNI